MVWTDCKHVARGVAEKIWNGSGPKVHAPRWRMVGDLMQGRMRRVEVRWTKAHLTAARQIELQIDPKVLIGNACADALAKRGAELAWLADNQEQSLTMSESMAWKVRRR